MRRVIITTGGTGGHIFPALSVAEELRSAHPEAELLFVGGKWGPEGGLARKAGLAFKALPVRGFLGRGLRTVPALFGLAWSLAASWFLIRSFRPDVVLGLGGYAGFPAVLAARMRKVPTAVHEQNSFPGIANRILGKWVDKVFLTFPDDHGFFRPEKIVLTGNPVRREIRDLAGKRAEREPGRPGRLLIFGGSQGARAINNAVIESLPEFKSMGLEIRHQTGNLDFERVKAAYQEIGYPEARVEKFIEDMAGAYTWADLVVCRGGAGSLSELTVAGKPSVVVPFPYATHNHQLNNAKRLEQAGAAVILIESLLQEVGLADVVGDLFARPEKLERMAKAAEDLGRPDAAARIVAELENLAEK